MKTDSELGNMFGYHRATAESAPMHAAVRGEILAVASNLNALVPEGREKALMFTKLQEAMHWGNSAIAMLDAVDVETPDEPNADKVPLKEESESGPKKD